MWHTYTYIKLSFYKYQKNQSPYLIARDYKLLYKKIIL